MSENQASKIKFGIVWACRILIGLTFILSGWSKVVDPYGFFYKIEEYLSVWHISGVIPDELIVTGSVGLSVFEFITGVLLATGCMRRVAPICALGLMAFMLPLTIYIYAANPVADCGCFGDMITLSNTATLTKKILLTAMLVIVLLWHDKTNPLFRSGIQWLVIALTGLYAIVLAIIGWTCQPVVDFRPYPVGGPILASDEANTPSYIYIKNGIKETFTLDNLPDSTWTFVENVEVLHANDELAIFDGEDEVTNEVLSINDKLLILTAIDPGISYLSRARFANELNKYASDNDIQMIALVAASDEALERWMTLARPSFEVYSAADTSLKQLARGKTALIFVDQGRIVWKRNLTHLDTNILDKDAPLEAVKIFDDGKAAVGISIVFLIALLLSWLIDLLLFKPKGTENVSKQL